MKDSLELTTRLSTDSEFKSLYSWFLQEYDADGAKVAILRMLNSRSTRASCN